MRDNRPPDDAPRRRRPRAWPWLLGLAVPVLLAVRLAHTDPAPKATVTPAKAAPAALAAAQAMRPAPVIIPAPSAKPDCGEGPTAAAQANAASLTTLQWAPFRGRRETGWEIYSFKIGAEIGAACGPDTPAFAAALARWQAAHGLTGGGVFDAATFKAMNDAWSMARPFVVASQHGACPPPPGPEQLVPLLPDETYGKPERLLPQALTAYRRMAAEARRTDPAIAADPKMLTVFSAGRHGRLRPARRLRRT